MISKAGFEKKYPYALWRRPPDPDCPTCGGHGEGAFNGGEVLPCFCVVLADGTNAEMVVELAADLTETITGQPFGWRTQARAVLARIKLRSKQEQGDQQ